jgi:hypothetical protein
VSPSYILFSYVRANASRALIKEPAEAMTASGSAAKATEENYKMKLITSRLMAGSDASFAFSYEAPFVWFYFNYLYE